MSEMGVKELLAWFTNAMSVYAVHTKDDSSVFSGEYDKIVKLIKDTYAYDERIDEIVEHCRRQDSTNVEVKCCRCGKTTMFYSIAPYGSKDDGDPICAECIDAKLIEDSERSFYHPSAFGNNKPLKPDSEPKVVDEELVEGLGTMYDRAIADIDRYEGNEEIDMCTEFRKNTKNVYIKLKAILQQNEILHKELKLLEETAFREELKKGDPCKKSLGKIAQDYDVPYSLVHIIEQRLAQDYEQNLTDCTEAIDALIEERDALIEDLEQKRVVADNTQKLSSENGNDINEGDK